MWFTRLAINRPVLIWMALAAIGMLGIVAWFRMPAELNPRTAIPTLTITTLWPGAGPQDTEEQVSRPIEDAVNTVAGVKDVSSASQADLSVVVVDFAVGTDLDSAEAEVRSRLDAVRIDLPTDARPPATARLDINAQPILSYGLTCASVDSRRLYTLADTVIRPRLARIAGVAAADIVGGDRREVRVSCDRNRLVRWGLTVDDVVRSLQAAGHDIPGGAIDRGAVETDVRLVGAFTDVDAIRRAHIVTARQPDSATPLTVADVATVVDGLADRTEIDRVNGQTGIGLVITKTADTNTVRVADAVQEALAQMAPQLPRDLHFTMLRDEAETVRNALDDVQATLLLGALLAMVVILLFLHNLRGTLIVSLAIPGCVVATFLALYAARFTINQMTLLALSLSVGILVDDSIVVLECITRRLKQGEAPRDAAFNGRAEVGFADITTTLVDVVVFVPIAFMGGIVGAFFKQFGLTIVAATLFSLLVSFSVTPMLASRWYRQGETLDPQRGAFFRLEKLYRSLEAHYRRILRGALKHPRLTLFLGVAALVVVFLASWRGLSTEFLPQSDLGQISVTLEMPAGASLAATDAVAVGMEDVIRSTPDVLAYQTVVGRIVGGFGYVPQRGSQFAQISVRLRDRTGFLNRLEHALIGTALGRTRTDEEVAAAIRAQLDTLARDNEAVVAAMAIRSQEGANAPVQVQLRGTDLTALQSFAAALRDRITDIPGILDPRISVGAGKPEIRARVLADKASRFGITPDAAGMALRDSIAGATAVRLRDGDTSVPVRVQLESAQRSGAMDIADVPVGADPAGGAVLLGDVADLARSTGPATIERQAGLRQIVVSANLNSGLPLSVALRHINTLVAQMPHPGIQVVQGGDAETVAESSSYFAQALLLAVALVYIVMASLFDSLATPFVIMFTLPMALIGALGALVVTGESMSLVSAIGIIMLIGLMGRNAILLLDYTRTLRKGGMNREEALEEAGATRLRPILMTTTATIAGMLPVALRIGRASEVRAPMAIVVIGGLLVSTALTLVAIPALYSLFDDLTRRVTRGRTAP